MPITFNVIKPETAIQLRAFSKAAEDAGRLLPEQLQVIYDHNWFKIAVPKRFGGQAMPLPEILMLEEDLAHIDGSLGWTVTLCSGATMFAGFLSREINEALFKNPHVCFGGSGAVTGTAEMTTGGYIVNGHWRYATGAPHLTVFTANCHIYKNGQPLFQEDGTPLYRSFIFTPGEVNIIADWNTMGLKTTAGHSFSVNDLFVTEDRCFRIHPDCVTDPGPLYKYPFIAYAVFTIAANTLGMAAHFFNECQDIAALKTQKKPDDNLVKAFNALLADALADCKRMRREYYDFAGASWDDVLAGKTIDDYQLQHINQYCNEMVKKLRAHVTALYPYCGVVATAADTNLNRIFRDIFTASQHSLLLSVGH